MGLKTPDRDPDPGSPLPPEVVKELIASPGKTNQRVALVALGEGRKLIAPLLEAMPCDAIDIVLEEWATQKEERPPLPAGVTLPSLLTEEGDPKLDNRSLDAVYFLDTYHLLFHGPTLLSQLHSRLTESGRVYVLDRQVANGDFPSRSQSSAYDCPRHGAAGDDRGRLHIGRRKAETNTRSLPPHIPQVAMRY